MTNVQKGAIALSASYGLVALIGGLIGYVKAGSPASLIAGGISGLILIASALVARQKPTAGLVVASLVSLALVGRFTKVALDGQALGVVAAVMIGGGLAVVVASALALFSRAPAAGRS